jgi:hypothetical protein
LDRSGQLLLLWTTEVPLQTGPPIELADPAALRAVPTESDAIEARAGETR